MAKITKEQVLAYLAELNEEVVREREKVAEFEAAYGFRLLSAFVAGAHGSCYNVLLEDVWRMQDIVRMYGPAVVDDGIDTRGEPGDGV